MKITEDKELDIIFKLGVGFIFNDFTKSPKDGKDFNKLHKATCSYMDSENSNRLKVEGKNRKLPKIFFETYDIAHEWLKTNRNDCGYSDCNICIKIK
jgi:hypothetical protein